MQTENLPPANQRIRDLIVEYSNDSVRDFCLKLGYDSSQKINRLFHIDRRNGKCPAPSIDVITDISNTFDISLEWIQYGTGNKHIDRSQSGEDLPEYKNEKKEVPYHFFQQLLDMQNDLIESNKALAEANKALSESNKVLIETNKKIVDLLDGKLDVLDAEAKNIADRAAGAV